MDGYLHDPDYPGHFSARGKQAARAEKTGGAYTRCRASSMHSKTSPGTMASRHARCAADDAHRSSLYAAS